MAAGIAREILGEAVLAESAGIAAYGESATDETIAVLDMKFGLDISEHHPRDVETCSPNDFDCVVAMDSYVSSHLKEKHPALAGNLVVWDIEDPYLKGMGAYVECAGQIAARMRELLSHLKVRPAGLIDQAIVRAIDYGAGLLASIDRLRQDTERWQVELQSDELRGTLLQGIAGKAVDEFDEVLRQLFSHYLAICEVNYDEALRPDVNGKSVEELTMGQVLNGFRKMNKEFTRHLRMSSRLGAEHLRGRRLLKDSTAKGLEELLGLRNTLHHQPHEFAKSEQALHDNTAAALTLIQDALADSPFVALTWDAEGKP